MSTSRTIRILPGTQTQLVELLDALDMAQEAFAQQDRRAGDRKPYRRRMRIGVVHPGGTDSVFEIVTRNLSAGGMSLIHGGYLHVGSTCELKLITTNNAWRKVTGRVVRCRLIRGRVHEIGVKFQDPIDLSDFIATRLRGTILLVDDAPDFLALAKDNLERHALTVVAVSSGLEALKKVESEELDLILIEATMSDPDGPEVIRTLRERGASVPIIAISVDDTSDCRETCLAAGANDFLPKPLDQQALADAIRHYVGNQELLISSFAADPDMEKFIAGFVRGLPARILAMRQAAQAQDQTRLLDQVRQLKAAAWDCGFEEICKAATEFEAALLDPHSRGDTTSHMVKVAALARRVE